MYAVDISNSAGTIMPYWSREAISTTCKAISATVLEENKRRHVGG